MKPFFITAFILQMVSQGAFEVPTCDDGMTFNNHEVLDENRKEFNFYWMPEEEGITMEIRVQTLGWVGVGFSKDGEMIGGDMVMGWVKGDGSVEFSDRHAPYEALPEIDAVQNYDLLCASENNTHTTMRIYRKWDTCDRTEDVVIPEGPAYVIWAYHINDPVDNGSPEEHTHEGDTVVTLRGSGTITEDCTSPTPTTTTTTTSSANNLLANFNLAFFIMLVVSMILE